MVTSLLKDVIKDADEQPDKKIQRVSSERVPSTGASVHAGLGWATLPVHGCVYPPGERTIPLGFLLEASSHRHDQSLTLFSALIPSQENGGQG